MSTPFNAFRCARQAGIQMTGGFAVVAECVTLDELERFAQIAISQALSAAPQIAINTEVIGYIAPPREWVGLTDEDMQDVIQHAMNSLTDGNNTFTLSANKVWVAIVREVEAKLKEKNQ